MAEENWVLISKNEPLSPGDRIRMFYNIIGPTYLLAAQVAAIENKLESDPRFDLITTSLPKGDGWVKDIWFEILIKKPPQKQAPGVQQAGIHVGIVAVVIASAFAVLGIFCWLSLREVRRMELGPLAKEVIKETGWTALKVGAAAIIGVIALKWWGK